MAAGVAYRRLGEDGLVGRLFGSVAVSVFAMMRMTVAMPVAGKMDMR